MFYIRLCRQILLQRYVKVSKSGAAKKFGMILRYGPCSLVRLRRGAPLNLDLRRVNRWMR
jgi:hypothetical protein